MTRNDEGDDGDDSCDEQLPRPVFILEEESGKGKNGSNQAAVGLGTEAKDDTCDEAPYADEQSLEGAITDFENTGTAHRETSKATEKSYEQPHLQGYVRIECTAMSAFIIFPQEINHQGCAYQRDTYPQPLTPILVPQHQGSELQQQEKCCGIAPNQKQVLDCQLLMTHHLGTCTGDDVQLLFCYTLHHRYVYILNIVMQI